MNSSVSFRRVASRSPRPARALARARSVIVRLASSRASVQRDAKRLLECLTTTSATGLELSQLVDSLSSASTPFKEGLLGGGPWVVRYTKGRPQWWNITYQPAKLLRSSNTASQDLEPTTRAVINRAEYFGGGLYVTAAGKYTPRDASTRTPKVIDVQVSSGMLHVAGFDVPLPIRGTGTFEVCYMDSNLRVFRSGSSYSVQVRAGYLGEARDRDASARPA